jgi:D-alanyl-D-alanine dipeptidase
MPRRAFRSLTVVAASIVAACRPHPAAVRLPIPPSVPPLLVNTEQLVVVTTPSWDAVQGTMHRFTRATTRDQWRTDGNVVPIVVGRTGLAWGIGFDAMDSGAPGTPHKHEGDGKAPAGVFPLDTVFGYAPPSAMAGLRMPYVQLTNASDCVDDTASVHYNTVVEKSAVPLVDWASAEHMRSVWQYEMGVIVGYNAPTPVRGRGSCIFLHIWGGPDSHTAGCTAFDREELHRVIDWLDRAKKPVLVQLTSAEYARWKDQWALPALR